MTIDGASPRSVDDVAASLTIRPATSSDAELAIRLIDRVYSEYGFVFVTADETPDLLDFDSIYRGGQAGFFVAVRDGMLVGTIGVKRHSPVRAELVRLYVAAAARRTGLGHRLVNMVVDWALSRSCQELELWSDSRFEAAHRLYRRMGFVQHQERLVPDVNSTREYRFVRSLVDV